MQKLLESSQLAVPKRGDIHRYDIVEGPMANDTVWNYVNDYQFSFFGSIELPDI